MEGARTKTRARARRSTGGLAALAAMLLACCTRCGGETPRPAAPVLDDGPASIDRGNLGTNLAAVVDWSTEEPFVDLFRMTRAPLSGKPDVWSDERRLELDADGQVARLAPGQVARTLVLTDSGRHRPGRYVVTFEGRGELRFGGAARRIDADSRPGRDVLHLPPTEAGTTGIILELVRTDPADPLRNVRILPPGGACAEDRARWCDASTPCPRGECLAFESHADELVFHPDFLSRTRPYRMLRFMDFMATNGSSIRAWSDRPRVEDATWTVRGVPLEVMARLANQLHAHPWFCIPHEADDEYVRSFATQVRDLVDADLTVWIEYSNEVWNSIFEQHRHAVRRGEELGLGEGFVAALRFYARRSREVHRIVREVLGPERLFRVVAAQADNPWVAEQILGHEDLGREVDALAIAPYFGMNVGPDQRDRVRAMSVDELVAFARERAIPEVLRRSAEHARLARRAGVPLVAYEAGQHFVGVEGVEGDPRIDALFDALNRDPRMGELYLQYLEGWRALGGGWLNHFTSCERSSRWGRWGALEHIRQSRESAPKYDALMRFRERHPRGW